MAHDDSTSHEGTSVREVAVGMAEALRLSTRFSVHSNAGEIPADLQIPIPRRTQCTFMVRSWGEVSDGEREAFRRFYVRFGEELEELAQRSRDGIIVDERVWSEITGALKTTATRRSA